MPKFYDPLSKAEISHNRKINTKLITSSLETMFWAIFLPKMTLNLRTLLSSGAIQIGGDDENDGW